MKIHRDRSRDDVRAAKDGPPLRGRPGKWTGANIPRMLAAMLGAWRPDHAGGVEHLGRAAWPALRPSPTQPPSPADHGHLRLWVRTLYG
jgi:hypothetical protein